MQTMGSVPPGRDPPSSRYNCPQALPPDLLTEVSKLFP